MIESADAKALRSRNSCTDERGDSRGVPKQDDAKPSCVSGQHRRAANNPASSKIRAFCVCKEKNSRPISPGSAMQNCGSPSRVLPDILRVRRLNGSGLLMSVC